MGYKLPWTKFSLSIRGYEFLKAVEGERLKAYKDQAGKLTIGVGHLLTPQELKTGLIIVRGKSYSWESGISQELSRDLLDQDLDLVENLISKHISTFTMTNQFDALASLVFNIGVDAFLGSSLFKLLKAGKYDAVPNEFMKWNKITDPKTKKKVVSSGLNNRRKKEVALWLGKI